MRRGSKKPCWPTLRLLSALLAERPVASALPGGSHTAMAASASSGQAMTVAWRVIRVQNADSRLMRSAGALPAMIAALMAPIEVPAYQPGWMPASCKAS